MRRATVISLIGHGAILAWALLSFSRALDTPPLESMAVDVISSDQLSKVTLGTEKAPQTEKPKPFADKIAEPTPPPEDLSAAVDKKTVAATTEQTNPEPTPPKLEPKPAAAPPESKTETKATPDKKEPEKKIDPIAEALKKDEAKKPETKAESKPQPVKKPEPQAPKFDQRKTADLLNKLKPTRTASAGSELNNTASLGTSKGREQSLSQNELDALRRRLASNWNIPRGTPESMTVRIYISLKRDGTLSARPEVETGSRGAQSEQLRESAIRAILASQPFDMLRPSTYETWQDLDITFSPRDMMM